MMSPKPYAHIILLEKKITPSEFCSLCGRQSSSSSSSSSGIQVHRLEAGVVVRGGVGLDGAHVGRVRRVKTVVNGGKGIGVVAKHYNASRF